MPPAATTIDRETLLQALDRLGAILRRQKQVGEIADCGGSAILLQFDWREGTRDVDVVVREGHGPVHEAARAVEADLALPAGWLSEAVAGYLSRSGDARGLSELGQFPRDAGPPALRVLVARPEYLFAMKALAARIETSVLAAAVGRWFPGADVPPHCRAFLREVARARAAAAQQQ
ncbi:MAG: hypothetical protein JNK11_03780 [Alphaproteobacteria bacterium]|nr:hypothetical protein [Alphaproteobacteria bacterium]